MLDMLGSFSKSFFNALRTLVSFPYVISKVFFLLSRSLQQCAATQEYDFLVRLPLVQASN